VKACQNFCREFSRFQTAGKNTLSAIKRIIKIKYFLISVSLNPSQLHDYFVNVYIALYYITMPTEAITSRSTSTIDPELAMEGGEGESSQQQQQQQQQEEIVLVRHDSDASSSSSTTTSTSSTINSNDNDNDERSLVVTLIGSIANLCSATLGAGM
jgi:hypothetical protein